MRNRPGIFISLIVAVVGVAAVLGFVVVGQSRRDAPKVSEQNRQYEANKRQNVAPSGADESQLTQQAPSEQVADEITADEPTGQSINVYFSKNPESERDPSKVFVVTRTATKKSPAETAVNEIIAGPNTAEKNEGFFGGIELTGDSTCDGGDFTVTMAGDVLTLQFCREHVSGGAIDDTRERAQLTATLQDVVKASKVIILDSSNNCLFEYSRRNACKV